MPQDNQQAYVWSSLAAAGGCRLSEAQQLRDNMARLLNAAQLIEAQREATLFFEQWQMQVINQSTVTSTKNAGYETGVFHVCCFESYSASSNRAATSCSTASMTASASVPSQVT